MDTTQDDPLPIAPDDRLDALRTVDPSEAPPLAEEIARELEHELDERGPGGAAGSGEGP